MKNLLVFICCGLICLTTSCYINATEAEEKTDQGTDKPKEVDKGQNIYTWIDKYGNRIYSDEPQEGAEVMKLKKGTDYSPPANAKPDWSTMKPKVISTGDIYSHFEIASPANDATIRNIEGRFQVALDIRPKLAKGHHIKLEMDGVKVSGSGQIITLTNIDRGSHSLVAYILSADGTVMATTQAVTVHLHKPKRGGG